MASLGDYPAAAVLRAEDLARAKKFYADVLGLKPGDLSGPVSEGMSEGMGMFRAGGGTGVMIYERPGMPAPQNTTLGFGVALDKFDEVIADLRGKGVIFEDYDLPDIGLKTVDGVGDYDGAKVAWFKDTEGNIINIASM